ncbi:MAG TPA: DNA mismatch repair protein MutS [Candidatus Acidoferrales bacterium]|nr:DNA mismatch repair protein MutS [Candidatus Acidoferrales bacterium]
MTEPTTPLMRQYHAVKKQHPSALLLFRLGDFYELFYDDAIAASRILQITLTSRNKEKGQAVPMCGVPYHAADNYITRLIRAGHKVAICEQMEQPGPGKKLVRREVIRVLTPGTATGASLIELKENNFLAAIARGVSRAKTRAARAQIGGSDAMELASSGSSEATDVNPVIGLAYLDLSTGDFRATEFRGEKAETRLRDEIEILQPREILTPRPTTLFGVVGASHSDAANVNATETRLDDWVFDPPYGTRLIEQQFRVAGLAGFGLDGRAQAVAAAGAIVHYLRETSSIGVQNSQGQPDSTVPGSGLEHLDRIAYYEQQDAMILDPVTARNLELVEPAMGDDASATLLRAIDETATGMGARLLRAWMLRPEISLAEIQTRLTAVAQLKAATVAREEIHKYLQGILDLERLTSRVTLALATPRDLLALRSSLEQVPMIRPFLASAAGIEVKEAEKLEQVEEGARPNESIAQANPQCSRLAELYARMDEMADVRDLITRGIADDPPALIGDPGAIRRGFNAELDELRDILKQGRQIIASMEERERKRTGIASLKIRYNQVFGYYIEISKANLHLAPADYDRKQTLVGAERFTSAELKEYESKVLSAEERVLEIERRLYAEIREKIARDAARLRRTAAAIAQTDVLINFARIAAARNYARPQFTEREKLVGSENATGPMENSSSSNGEGPTGDQLRASRGVLMIAGGRHPVIEKLVEERGERFVPNELYLDDDSQFLLIITGPNMGGKSTYLRQAALISILAQMGSFVPATQARVPIFDRVFTRIGASDNLSRGRSTFLVEMSEVAAILNMATSNSLVLLDEVGRGTSTFDGLSIAWAVVEALHGGARPRTLFATHYHELTELEQLLPGVKNVHVSVHEAGSEIVFLRRVEPGSADKSYGIEVARLAGLPNDVIVRAREILRRHERSEDKLTAELSPGSAPLPQQTSFTAIDESVVEAVRTADLNQMTPLEALKLLDALQRQLK